MNNLQPLRRCVSAALLLGCLSLLADVALGENATDDHQIKWTDARALGVEGQGWTNTESLFDRLPAKARTMVRRPVWKLSHDSAGMLVRFVTDARDIHARWALTSTNLAMPHMTATGVSGLDLYVRTSPTAWHWLAIAKPRAVSNIVALVTNGLVGRHEFLLYLPLYNGVRSLEIGVPEGAKIEKAGPWGLGVRKPVVFYGTSILQGCSASRPGMAHSAILGRRFNWPIINLGFSGNGKMEPELASLLSELDPSIYVLDCVPNMTSQQVAERVEPFVHKLRETHPATPIVLIEDRTYGYAFFFPEIQARQSANRAALKQAYKNLKKSGIKDLYYIPGESLLGDDGDATVDGSHPTDLGMTRQANVIAKVLAPLLKKQLR